MAQQSLHTVIRTAAMDINEASNFVFLEFFDTYPAQVGLLGLQLLWTKKAEEALKTAKYDRFVKVFKCMHTAWNVPFWLVNLTLFITSALKGKINPFNIFFCVLHTL